MLPVNVSAGIGFCCLCLVPRVHGTRSPRPLPVLFKRIPPYFFVHVTPAVDHGRHWRPVPNTSMRSLCMLCSFRMMPPTVPNLPGVRSFEDFVTLFSHSSGRLPSARVRTLPMQLITVARQQQLMGLCRHDGSKVCLWQHARRAPQASGANAAASATSTLASWSHRICCHV